MRTLKMTGAASLLCAMMASACADSSPSLLPTSPSAVSAASSNSLATSAQSGSMGSPVVDLTPAAGDISGLGNGHGNGNGNGNGGGNPNANGGGNGNGNPNANGGGNGNGNPNGNGGNGPPAQTPGPPAPKKVELEGLIEAIAGTVLTVNGQAVTVPVTVVVHHGSKVVPFADLAVGDRVHVKAELLLDVLTATDVKLQNPGDGTGGTPGTGTPLTVDGFVSSLSATACPAKTFMVGTQLVETNNLTTFTGGACVNIVNLGHVTVVGVLTSGTLVATQVTIF